MSQRRAQQQRELRCSPILLLGPLIMLACMATSSSAQQRVLKLVDIKKDPPCSTWGDITACAPDGGAITWAGSLNTTFTWTVPPAEIGPGGVSISLSVSQSNPPERKSATGLRMTGNGFVFTPANADVPIGAGNQPLSGNVSVNVKPPANPSGDYYLKIGVYWGPGFIYHYRAEAATNAPSSTDKPAERPHSSLSNEVRVVNVTCCAEYHKGGTAPGAWLPIEKDTVLKQGDQVTTDPDGEVTVAFADNSTVVIKNVTALSIASYFTEGGVIRTEILLKMGEIDTELMRKRGDFLPGRWDFKIKTPTFDAGVRGTKFTTRYDPKTQTGAVMVQEGVVEVTPTNSSLSPVTLHAGEQLQVTPNRVGNSSPTAPKETIKKDRPAIVDKYRAVSGRWSGSWADTRGESGESTINLKEEGGAITGDEDGWIIENGRRSGHLLTWEYRNQDNGCRDYNVQLQISADGKTANGTYTVTDRCEGKTFSGKYLNYRR